jgi:hypothetical protein
VSVFLLLIWDAANRLVSAEVDGVVSTYAYNLTGGFAPAWAIPSPLALRGTNCCTAQTVDGVATPRGALLLNMC